MSKQRILITNESPPTPDRNSEWCARFETREPTGRGPTPEAALDELLRRSPLECAHGVPTTIFCRDCYADLCTTVLSAHPPLDPRD